MSAETPRPVIVLKCDMLELTAQFACLIGTRWNDLYPIVKDSVALTYMSIQWAEEFLALWYSGYLDQDDSWLEHIDEYFELKYNELTGEEYALLEGELDI